jgi:hypothetical protein
MAVGMAKAEHQLIHSEPFAYCAHPHGVRLASGKILVVFNRAPRRSFILHPPQDPAFENVIVASEDGGETWSAPSVAPDYGWSGVECAGLTALKCGRVLLHQWRFRWHPLGLARKRAAEGEALTVPIEWAGALAASAELDSGGVLAADPERLAPWARGAGGAYVHVSDDAGDTFANTVAIDCASYSGGYGMRGAVELDDGTLVLPLSDVPHYKRVFVVRSGDGGKSWDVPVAAAERDGLQFEEPAPLLLPSRRILLAMRENVGRTLYRVHSDDGGDTWSEPVPMGIDGYPAHLLRLADGRLLCTYGFRKPPFAIRAVLSEDSGATWNGPIGIREGLPNKDLGYPSTLALSETALLTIYYAQDLAGTTGIWQSRWSLD